MWPSHLWPKAKSSWHEHMGFGERVHTQPTNKNYCAPVAKPTPRPTIKAPGQPATSTGPHTGQQSASLMHVLVCTCNNVRHFSTPSHSAFNGSQYAQPSNSHFYYPISEPYFVAQKLRPSCYCTRGIGLVVCTTSLRDGGTLSANLLRALLNACPIPPMHIIVRLLTGHQSSILSSYEWHNDRNLAFLSATMAPSLKIKEITTGTRTVHTHPKSKYPLTRTKFEVATSSLH